MESEDRIAEMVRAAADRRRRDDAASMAGLTGVGHCADAESIARGLAMRLRRDAAMEVIGEPTTGP